MVKSLNFTTGPAVRAQLRKTPSPATALRSAQTPAATEAVGAEATGLEPEGQAPSTPIPPTGAVRRPTVQKVKKRARIPEAVRVNVKPKTCKRARHTKTQSFEKSSNLGEGWLFVCVKARFPGPIGPRVRIFGEIRRCAGPTLR